MEKLPELADSATIASFDHPIEANLAKTRLEAEGIECVLTNEHIAGMNWVWAPTIGGVGLQVLEADARRALEPFSRASPCYITTERTARRVSVIDPQVQGVYPLTQVFRRGRFALCWKRIEWYCRHIAGMKALRPAA